METKRSAIWLIFLTFAAQAFAAEMSSPVIQTFEGKVRPKDWQQLAIDPAQPRRFIEITHDIELSCRTPGGGPSARAITILKGAYSIERRLHNKKSGTDWLVVPAVSSRPVKFGYNNAAGRTWGYEHVIAVSPDALAIFPREIVRYTQEWSRLDGSRWNETNWSFGCLPTISNTANRPALRFVSEEQFRLVRDGEDRQIVREALDNSVRHKEALDRERPLKSKIGVQLCRASGPLILQGFTEERSPDSEKLKIRIWRASLSDDGRPSTTVPGDFRESVVWDHPDNWNLCE